jgi:hypothetical protein
MDDLIARATKYARSGGRTGAGQYRAAERDERAAQILSWTSTALTAVVGTSIFTTAIQTNPIPFGLLAMVASTLSAIQGSSKLAERAAAHRTTGAGYGGVRRRADELCLMLRAGDLTREQGLSELHSIGKALNKLAAATRPLPDRIYEPAKVAFDRAHPEYDDATSAPVRG